MSPFDFLNAINSTKENLIVDDITEKQYNAFMINRGLSYFQDTTLIANEMNMTPYLDSKLQFDFLISMVRKRKRFSKWAKPQLEDDIEAIKKYYGYSNEKAKVAISLLTKNQINIIKRKIDPGGRLGKSK